jgi:hypothetical protein
MSMSPNLSPRRTKSLRCACRGFFFSYLAYLKVPVHVPFLFLLIFHFFSAPFDSLFPFSLHGEAGRLTLKPDCLPGDTDFKMPNYHPYYSSSMLPGYPAHHEQQPTGNSNPAAFGGPLIQPAPAHPHANVPSSSSPSGPAATSQQQPLPPAPVQHQSPGRSPANSATSASKRKQDPTTLDEAARLAQEEDKRRRNTAASARFRIKKKEREKNLERTVKEVTAKNTTLENRITQLEMENRWLKNLITEKNGSAISDGDLSGMFNKFRQHNGEAEQSHTTSKSS